MNHLSIIQREFVKEAAEWNDLSQEAQKEYLKAHPKSKRRVTAKPAKEQTMGEILDERWKNRDKNAIKAKLEQRKKDLESGKKIPMSDEERKKYFPEEVAADKKEWEEWDKAQGRTPKTPKPKKTENLKGTQKNLRGETVKGKLTTEPDVSQLPKSFLPKESSKDPLNFFRALDETAKSFHEEYFDEDDQKTGAAEGYGEQATDDMDQTLSELSDATGEDYSQKFNSLSKPDQDKTKKLLGDFVNYYYDRRMEVGPDAKEEKILGGSNLSKLNWD
jgi:hypothetical protein